MNARNIAIAFAAGIALGLLSMWLFLRPAKADSARMEQLIRDSTAYAGWAEKRDEQLDSMNLAFELKDDALSWTREKLEHAIHHRKPSRLGDDSLLHEIRRAVGDLPP